MEYTTLANLKTRLWITDTAEDAYLQSIITQTTRIMDNYIWCNLELADYEEYVVNNFSSKTLFFPNKPIVSISEILDFNGEDITSNIRRYNINIVYLDVETEGEVKAKYSAWYENLSDIPDVETVCLDFCSEAYRLNASGKEELAIKQRKVEDLSVTYFSRKETEEGSVVREKTSFETILDNYRVLDIHSF